MQIQPDVSFYSNSSGPLHCLSTFQERVDLTIYQVFILKLSLYATNYNVLLLTLQLNCHKSYLRLSAVDRICLFFSKFFPDEASNSVKKINT